MINYPVNAPGMAAVMLRFQQADAMIAARNKAGGVNCMVKAALEKPKSSDVVVSVVSSGSINY